MKRPVALIVGGAVGAFLIAMVGVSAQTGGLNLNLAGTQQARHGDDASGARTEPKESPEASPKPEPSEKPEPTPTAKPTAKPTEAPDEDDDDNSNSGDSEGPERDSQGDQGSNSQGGGGDD
jgi:hypothetical protein